MQFKSLKGLLLATSAIAGLTFAASSADAADNASVSVSIQQIAAVEAVNLTNMQFGRWILNHDGAGGDIALVMDTTGDIAPTAGGTSTAVEIDPTSGSSAGRIGVLLPSGIDNYELSMTVADFSATNFTDTNYVLSALTYGTVTEGANQAVTADGTTVHPVTVVTGGVQEVVNFGATITVSGTPTAGVANDASFTATFAY